jgi:hypothetical protein
MSAVVVLHVVVLAATVPVAVVGVVAAPVAAVPVVVAPVAMVPVVATPVDGSLSWPAPSTVSDEPTGAKPNPAPPPPPPPQPANAIVARTGNKAFLKAFKPSPLFLRGLYTLRWCAGKRACKSFQDVPRRNKAPLHLF